MKLDFSFSKILDNDKIVKVLSVVVAVILWLIVTIYIDPDGFATIKEIPVNLDLVGTTPEAYGLSVIEGDGQTVNAKIEGKRYRFASLSEFDFIAVPTLTTVTKAGEYDIRVDVKKVNSSDGDYEVISTPTTIKVRFDELVEVTIPIVASAEKIKPATGYIKEEPFVNPAKITLKGPQTEIKRISKCVVSTAKDMVVDDSTTLEGTVNFYDSSNNKITLQNTTYEKQKYDITIPINKFKTVPLTFSYVNIPQGLDTTKLKYAMSTESLEIAGPKKTIDEISEISLGEIDFRNIDVGSTVPLEVTLPASIVNLKNIREVIVEFTPELLTSKQFTITNIVPRNIPATYDIDIKTDKITNVKIVGNIEDIKLLSESDLFAIVDFTGKELTDGNSRIAVQIYATGNKFVWAVGDDYRVLVNATKKP